MNQRVGALISLPMLAVGCADREPDPAASPSTEAVSRQQASQSPSAGVTPVEILIETGGHRIAAELADNPTAADLAAQLPLTLTFRDLNSVEKIARLPESLTMQGVPEGEDPSIGDIGYYAPSQDLVLYYGDVGYWNGIVRIGRFDAAQLSLVEGQPDGFQAVIATE